MLLHLVLLLLLLQFVAVVRPAGAARLVRRFPARSFPDLGTLQQMPELQCFSPCCGDPPLAALDGKPIWRGNDTRASPVVEVAQVLAASQVAHAKDDPVFFLLRDEQRTPVTVRRLAKSAVHEDKRMDGTSWALPLEKASDGPSTGDFEDVTARKMSSLGSLRALLMGLLMLQRNTDSGEVCRVSGQYEVLAITSVSRAVCLLPDCAAWTAVDTTGRGACSASECDRSEGGNENVRTEDAVTIVTHSATAWGAPAPVSTVQRGFLGLGGAAMVQGGWLPNPSWDLTAHLHACIRTDPGDAPRAMQETGCSNWTLNGCVGPVLDARPAGWLAKVTFALCQVPVPRYLDEKLLCKGTPQQVPHTEEVRYNHEAFGVRDTEGRKRTIVYWHVISEAPL